MTKLGRGLLVDASYKISRLYALSFMIRRFFMFSLYIKVRKRAKRVSEYDQEIPQSQTADNPVAQRGRAAQPPRDTRKTN